MASARGGRRPARLLDRLEERARPFPPESEPEPGSDPEAEAFARGREQGYREGAEHATAELEQRIESCRVELVDALRRLVELEEARAREHHARIAELVLEAASLILRERIERDDPAAARALKQAIAALPPAAQLRARLHPADVDSVRTRLAAEIERGRLELAPDDAISRGGCVVESSNGTIDATVETAVDAAGQALAGEADSP